MIAAAGFLATSGTIEWRWFCRYILLFVIAVTHAEIVKRLSRGDD
jgi:type IV secretory pathway VirB2 component (pilin)